jgi:hypothetical protein
VGEKTFVDNNIPEGTRTVTYQLTARRSNKVSEPSGNFLVRLGTEGGQMVIKRVKLAA